MEVFGYGIRLASAKDTSKKPPFVAQYVLIVLSPVLMTGIIYVAFGRIVFHVIPVEHRSTKLLWVSRKYLIHYLIHSRRRVWDAADGNND